MPGPRSCSGLGHSDLRKRLGDSPIRDATYDREHLVPAHAGGAADRSVVINTVGLGGHRTGGCLLAVDTGASADDA
jgi:hypothetical protein